jgi:CspA family cold shock protein
MLQYRSLQRHASYPSPSAPDRQLSRQISNPPDFPASQIGAIMSIGVVKFFSGQKGFGFITPDDGGKDVFVHISAVEQSGLTSFGEGVRVSYELERDNRGRVSAVKLSKA